MQSVVETLIDCSEKIQNQNNTISTQQTTINGLNEQVVADNNNFDDIYDAIVAKGQTPTKDDRTTYAPAINNINTGGTYQSKTVSPSSSQQTVLPDQGYDALSQVVVNAAALQNKTVTPSTSQQSIQCDSGNYGLDVVTVDAVTASIDNNITSQNIRKNVQILGVTGVFEGETTEIYSTSENAGTETGNKFEETLVEYNNKMYIVTSSDIYEYDEVNEAFTAVITGSDIITHEYRICYKSCVVGKKIYCFRNSMSTYSYIDQYDFETNTKTTLATITSTVGLDVKSICSDGVYIYLASASNNKLYKLDISTSAVSEVCSLTRIYTSMVYRNGYIFGVRGDYVDKIDVSNGTVTPLFNTSNNNNEDYYRALIADSDYIYLIGGYGNTNKILRFNDSNYEAITVTDSYRQCAPLIFKGDLYCINFNEYNRSDHTLHKIGSNLNKDTFVSGSQVGISIDTKGIKKLTIV